MKTEPIHNLNIVEGTDLITPVPFNENTRAIATIIGPFSESKAIDKRNVITMVNEALLSGSSPPPFLNEETETWWQWDQVTRQYVDTGVRGTGPAAGFGTPSATALTLPYDVPASASIVASGPDTAKVFDLTIGVPGGPRGPRGEVGAGLQILGQFDTLYDLQAAHPTGNPGDMYTVGIILPRDTYQWNELTEEWVSEGPMAGGGGTVKSFNEVYPDGVGKIVADADDIPLDNAATVKVSIKTAFVTKADLNPPTQPNGDTPNPEAGKLVSGQFNPWPVFSASGVETAVDMNAYTAIGRYEKLVEVSGATENAQGVPSGEYFLDVDVYKAYVGAFGYRQTLIPYRTAGGVVSRVIDALAGTWGGWVMALNSLMRGAANGVADLNANGQLTAATAARIDNNPWELAALLSGVTNPLEGYPLSFRKTGNVVEINGLISLNSIALGIVICNLPNGYRPSKVMFPISYSEQAGYPAYGFQVLVNGNFVFYRWVPGAAPSESQIANISFDYIASL